MGAGPLDHLIWKIWAAPGATLALFVLR